MISFGQGYFWLSRGVKNGARPTEVFRAGYGLSIMSIFATKDSLKRDCHNLLIILNNYLYWTIIIKQLLELQIRYNT
ncbi:MAG: hypothetical protein ACI9VN_002677 [Patescibacteria group bacterium]|jgi:hypothetical protein